MLHHAHMVQFYEEDHVLCETVADFLAAGLTDSQSLLLITTDERREALAQRLHARGFEVGGLGQSPGVTFLDARRTLDTIMVEGMPDERLFREHVGGGVASGLEGPRAGARVYGDMVDLLWRDGNPDGALRLEELWNDLARTHRFELLCAYHMGSLVDDTHRQPFDAICALHSHVVPTPDAIIRSRRRVDEERERLLESARAARADAERSTRLKDEFLAVLSHELRTPLNAVLGCAQILKDERSTALVKSHAVEVIHRNAALQLRLIEDLLDVSRIVAGKMRVAQEPVDLADVIESTIDNVRPAADAKGLALHLDVDANARPVVGDTARLQQVMWNLLSNAIKFTPAGGRVSVRLEQAGAQARISVRDTGQGISPELLPCVFERFRQGDSSTTRTAGGMGLGLTLVRYLAEAHGGTVSAESAGEGMGATFTVTIPLRIGPADAAGAASTEIAV